MAYASDNGYVFDNRPIFRGGVNIETLSGNKVLNAQSETFHLLTLDQARDLNLPEHKEGSCYFIRALSFTLSIKDADDGAVETLTAGNSTILVSDGSNWAKVG